MMSSSLGGVPVLFDQQLTYAFHINLLAAGLVAVTLLIATTG